MSALRNLPLRSYILSNYNVTLRVTTFEVRPEFSSDGSSLRRLAGRRGLLAGH